MPRPKKIKTEVSLTLTIGKDVYSSTGEGPNKILAVTAALLKLKPKVANGVQGLIEVEKDGHKAVTKINAVQLRRLFNFGGFMTKVMQTVIAKRIAIRL